MISDGTPWRPLVHALDIAKAIRCVLEAPRELVHDEVFNVGSSEQNYRVREIAEIVGAEFPGCEVTFGARRRRQPQLPGLLRQDPQQAARLRVRLGRRQRGTTSCTRCSAGSTWTTATFTGRGHTRLKQLQHLIATGQVDDELFWRTRRDHHPYRHRGRGHHRPRAARPTTAASSPGRSASTEFGAAGLETAVEQCNLSFNHKAGTLRGMHYQVAPHPEAKLVRCIRGAIVDIIVDMRPDSATRLQHVSVELTAEQPASALRAAVFRARLPDPGRRHRGDSTRSAAPTRRPPSAGCAGRPGARARLAAAGHR